MSDILVIKYNLGINKKDRFDSGYLPSFPNIQTHFMINKGETMEFNQGNISTIVAMLWTILSPYIAQYITQDAFISICGLIIIVWSACNPNTFEAFGNAVNKTIKTDETVLNDEYECGDGNDGC